MTSPSVATYRVIVPVADLVDIPARKSIISSKSSQLLYGEAFLAAEERGAWVRGQSVVDGYEGWVHKSQLTPEDEAATHFVDLPWTHIYPEADFKTRPLHGLPFMARITLNPALQRNGFVSIPGKGWVFARHIRPLSSVQYLDPVYTAMRFLGVPYLFGGRSALGIDCSGLTQLALSRAGVFCPRDSGPQSKEIGQEIARADIQKGDFVFFPGHVGLMIDDRHVVNASSRTMCVDVETLDDLDAVYGDGTKGGITAIRRVVQKRDSDAA